MNRAKQTLAIMAVSMLGMWGCARGPSVATGEAERIKALEAKATRLEDDYRAAANARDQLRKKLAAAEEQVIQLRQELAQLRPVVPERDELREQLKVRTSERDTVLTQFEQFRTSIRNLLGQTEAALNAPPTVPVTTHTTSRTKGQL